MRRLFPKVLTVLSTVVFLTTCLDWYRSMGTSDSITWHSYAPCEFSVLESHETSVGVVRGGLLIFQQWVKCDPSTAIRLPVPADWRGEAGFRFNSEPPFFSDTGPFPTFEDQFEFRRESWGAGRPFFSLWGMETRHGTEMRIPLWPLVLLTSILPGRSLIRRLRSRLKVRPGSCATCGYDLRASPDRCPECGLDVPTAEAKLVINADAHD